MRRISWSSIHDLNHNSPWLAAETEYGWPATIAAIKPMAAAKVVSLRKGPGNLLVAGLKHIQSGFSPVAQVNRS
jgi:hypothetical protein